MENIKINPSAYIFFAAGLTLLLSLSLLPDGQLIPWIGAKILYVLGTILFVFNK